MNRISVLNVLIQPVWRLLIVVCPQLLQQNLETNFYSGQVCWDEVSPNDAAALLKKFIRELPAPLLTAEYLNTFSAVRGVNKCSLLQQLSVYIFGILGETYPGRDDTWQFLGSNLWPLSFRTVFICVVEMTHCVFGVIVLYLWHIRSSASVPYLVKFCMITV